MRVVLDTNVLVAAYAAHGLCHDLLEESIRSQELHTSDLILTEFRQKLIDKLDVPAALARENERFLRKRIKLVKPAALPEPVCRDPDDDEVLGTAVAAEASHLVTGDSDLLVLVEYAGIQIVSPTAFWKLIHGK